MFGDLRFEIGLIQRIVRLFILYDLSDGDGMQFVEANVGLIIAVDRSSVEEEMAEEADKDRDEHED